MIWKTASEREDFVEAIAEGVRLALERLYEKRTLKDNQEEKDEDYE